VSSRELACPHCHRSLGRYRVELEATGGVYIGPDHLAPGFVEWDPEAGAAPSRSFLRQVAGQGPGFDPYRDDVPGTRRERVKLPAGGRIRGRFTIPITTRPWRKYRWRCGCGADLAVREERLAAELRSRPTGPLEVPA
jgi:hypothetical protein